MKIRNGFVSNSSSSSFIIGVAKVADIDKLKKYIDNKGIKTDYEFNIITKYDLEQNPPWQVKVKNNEVVLESFRGDIVSLKSDDMIGLDVMLIYDYTGHDDSDFWNGDEYDYDIDLSLFYENERKIYNMFFDEESGIDTETSQVQYGAGRNG